MHSRYAGQGLLNPNNVQYNQQWVDLTSPLTTDDVLFSSDDVPGTWATIEEMVYPYLAYSGVTSKEAFFQSYNYMYNAYNAYHYANEVPADLKVAVDLKQEFESAA